MDYIEAYPYFVLFDEEDDVIIEDTIEELDGIPLFEGDNNEQKNIRNIVSLNVFSYDVSLERY